MKKAAALAILGLALAAAAGAQTISVTSPAAGSELCRGTACAIAWTKSGRMPGSVTIQLRRAGSRLSEPAVLDIAASAMNSGNYSWPIPASLAAGDYFIRVKTIGAGVAGNSANFKIKVCGDHDWIRVMQLPLLPGRISGRISGGDQGNLIRDHRVRVVLKRAGAIVSSGEYLLDAAGNYSYQFWRLPLGTYEVTVEKAPGRPGTTLNPCFNGTTPARHTVVLDDAAPNATGRDFLIQFSLAWGINPDCW